MMYLLPTASDNMRGLSKDRFGVMSTPKSGVAWGVREGYRWGADSGAFTKKFDGEQYLAWLETMKPYRTTCLFVTCPDAVADASETLKMYKKWSASFTDWPLAFVAQDGQEDLDFPEGWNVLFIGGSTEWKMSDAALSVIRRAKGWVHVGRVNSLKRAKHFMLEGVDSVDGTSWIYAPSFFAKKIDEWMRHMPLPERMTNE